MGGGGRYRSGARWSQGVADGCCRLRLSGCVFRDTEAVSSAFFNNPIELQPAGVHIDAHIISVAFEIEFPAWLGDMPDRI